MSLVETNRLSGSPVGAGDRDRPYVRESYPAVPSAVAPARHAIAECAAAAGAGPEQLGAIALASSEALANAALYAYRTRPGYVHVTVRVAGGELWVLIADNGCGIHAGPDSDGLGVGLALITQLTDGFSVVERSTGGTELRMRFKLDPGESG
jgi:anti-sigma regulatory factor (Ser/Thr protein kinase)